MADWTSVIGPVIGAVGKGVNSFATADKADEQMQEAYRQVLANLQTRMGDYDALGSAGYTPIDAQQLGPSAFENIPEDLQSRQAQQESMAALQELANNGGLSLADLKALNDVQRNLNQNNMARQKGLANEFAARGQLGSGAQLAMSLAGQQNAAQNANQAGESAAAQAQARALQAILQRGQMARGMGNDDWQRKAEAARARDIIEARNAAARTDASKYNNTLQGQNFQDQLAKAQGKTSLTNATNKAIFGRGQQNALTTLGKGSTTNSLIDSGAAAFSKLSGNTDANADSNTFAQRGSPSDLSLDDDEK